MNIEVVGQVVSVSRQWWVKVNRQPIRILGTNGAIYPYIVKVCYIVNGMCYYKRKWIDAGNPVPMVGTSVRVICDENRPSKAKILLG